MLRASLRPQLTLWLGRKISRKECFVRHKSRNSHPTHQQGNNARPPGHDASWTAAHHCSAEQTAAAAFGPASAPAVIRDDSPWPSGQVQPRITLRHLPVLNTRPRGRTGHSITQHTSRGKTNVLQSDNYATSTV